MLPLNVVVRRFVFGFAASVAVAATVGCPSASGPNYNAKAQWPKASSITPQALPAGVGWQGVWFISTAGSRGTMHLFTEGDD